MPAALCSPLTDFEKLLDDACQDLKGLTSKLYQMTNSQATKLFGIEIVAESSPQICGI